MQNCGCFIDEADVIKPSQKERLQKAIREEDWEYIAKHPEIRIIVKSFLRKIFREQPRNLHRFAADFAKSLREEHGTEMNLQEAGEKEYMF